MSSSRPVWDEGPAMTHAALAGDVHADLCVIGLGGSGLTCVREALRLGARVVGIDASCVGGGAAGRNGGFLLAGLAHFHHDAVARYGRARARTLYHHTREELDRIAMDTPDGVVRNGSLRIAESDDEMSDCHAQLAALRADGFEAEEYSGAEGRGLLIAGDGSFQPLTRCHALAALAVREGAMLHEQSPAVAIDTALVRTTQGRVHCRHVVIAVDGGLERVLPELAPRVRSARLQMLATAPVPAVQLPRPVYARWGYDYWQQRPDGAIALGGCRDVGGQSEWTRDATPTVEVQLALEHRLRRLLGVDAAITHRWAAIVGYTPDGLPVVGEVRPGIWALGGYSGTGNVVGALLGRGVARALYASDASIVRAFSAC